MGFPALASELTEEQRKDLLDFIDEKLEIQKLPFSGFLSRALNTVNPSVSFLSVDHKAKTYLRSLASFTKLSFVLLLLLIEMALMSKDPLFLFLTVWIFEKVVLMIFLIFKIFKKSKSYRKSKISVDGQKPNSEILKKLKFENLILLYFSTVELLYLSSWLLGGYKASLMFGLLDSLGQILRWKLQRKHSFLSPKVNTMFLKPARFPASSADQNHPDASDTAQAFKVLHFLRGSQLHDRWAPVNLHGPLLRGHVT